MKIIDISTTMNVSISLGTNDSKFGLVDAEDIYVISNVAGVIFQWVNFTIICQAIVVFGTFSNMINIICFVKQGFKDSVNVSLFGLAISDLGCLLTLVFVNLSLTPAFQDLDLPFDALEVEYLTVSWPHVTFSRVSSWITALVTLERCLCITVPLKVKNIVTPKRVSVIIVCTFTILICSSSPVYCVNRLAMKFNPERNRSILGLVYTEDRSIVEAFSFTFNNIVVPLIAFMTVSICTIILVVEMYRKTKWRMTVTADKNGATKSSRDRNVAKMVVMISTLFIVCFIPVVINFGAMMVEPEFAIDGKYRILFTIVFGLGFTLESINSSMNIFIYYSMSSRYRSVFRQLFGKRELVLKNIL